MSLFKNVRIADDDKGKTSYGRRIVRLGYILSTSFLVIHIALLWLFYRCGVTPMAYFNVFSVAFYLFSSKKDICGSSRCLFTLKSCCICLFRLLFVLGNEAAKNLYHLFGFAETGETDGGETVAVLKL